MTNFNGTFRRGFALGPNASTSRPGFIRAEVRLLLFALLYFALCHAMGAQELAGTYPSRVRRLVLAATTCGIGSTAAGWDVRDGVGVVMNGLVWANPLSTIWRVMAYSAWSSIPYLGNITAPTLVVCGRDDRVAPIGNSRTLAGRIPNATLVELAEGHDLQEPEAAERLAYVVEGFLARGADATKDSFTL